jgi:hypothetical protein
MIMTKQDYEFAQSYKSKKYYGWQLYFDCDFRGTVSFVAFKYLKPMFEVTGLDGMRKTGFNVKGNGWSKTRLLERSVKIEIECKEIMQSEIIIKKIISYYGKNKISDKKFKEYLKQHTYNYQITYNCD